MSTHIAANTVVWFIIIQTRTDIHMHTKYNGPILRTLYYPDHPSRARQFLYPEYFTIRNSVSIAWEVLGTVGYVKLLYGLNI